MINTKNKIRIFLLKYTPIILLFTSILNDIDFNNLGLKYFSFNFSYILIFYYNLKREDGIGYIYIFIAGLFNDVINGIPMGISSLCYLVLCAAAAYLRNITLRPNIFKDWIFFLITILVLNFITFTYLVLYLNFEINYFDRTINIIFTFLLYVVFSYLFKAYDNVISGKFY
jgi:rod shape-determining protein MreD|tara:strand:+ start:1511 stop:2023 length:513 start_codon:yes stop_codon:yes gene_type:complete